MYLRNFTDAINTVIAREEFSYILNEFDFDTIKKFMNLKCKLFWIFFDCVKFDFF